MSILKKKIIATVASIALIGLFTSCNELAAPSGSGENDTLSSCEEIWGINSKCAEMQEAAKNSSDSKGTVESSASEETGEEACNPETADGGVCPESSASDQPDCNGETDNCAVSDEGSEGGESSNSGSGEGSNSDENSGTDSDENSGTDSDEKTSSASSSGSEDSSEGKTEADDPENNNSKDDVTAGEGSYQITEGCKADLNACASIGTSDMDNTLTQNEKDALAELAKNPDDNFSKAEDETFNLSELDFNNNNYFCFTGDGDWLRITYETMSKSSLAFLRNGHAWGQRKKYEIRFEDACDAVYIQRKTN